MSENSQCVLLRYRCENLKSLSFIGESDPYIEIYIDSEHIGSTEVLKNNKNPIFTTPTRVNFYFETHQTITFKVFDKDKKKSELIGKYTCSLSDIVVSGVDGYDADLKLNSKVTGKIIITPEEINVERGETDYSLLPAISGLVVVESINENVNEPLVRLTELVITATGHNLDSMDRNGKSDPYFIIERDIVEGEKERIVIYQSKVIKKTLNPIWNSFLISAHKFGPKEGTLYISVYDWDLLSSNSLIGTGEFQMSYPEIDLLSNSKITIPISRKTKIDENHQSGVVELSLHFYSPKIDDKNLPKREKIHVKRQKKLKMLEDLTKNENYHIVGKSDLVLKQKKYPKLVYPIKFVSLLQRGLVIQTHCALDFTISNEKNHKLREKYFNPYEFSLNSVVPILLRYNKNQKIPVYGYGASLNEQDDITPPFFHLNLQETPECDGLDGILEAYRTNLSKITLGDMGNATGGDTDWRANKGRYFRDDFYQVINHICDLCERELPSNLAIPPPSYHILFFIIDGDRVDVAGTNRALIRASALPISIILIGLGNTNFKNLKKFDADKRPLIQDGVSEVRDCCQFVQFNKCKDKKKLRKEVLAEIPLQVEQYYALYGVNMPNRDLSQAIFEWF
ncbi:copine-8 [Anaeramoeba flamelloides]|uniref:Copine-8 n=1 Tax=Anaeramoeba flamelloides TaxID=1746091 RepID=A0ABQ8XH16_9EUKA|nr:copine-8 [Anaeramoeba flamelloides]